MLQHAWVSPRFMLEVSLGLPVGGQNCHEGLVVLIVIVESKPTNFVGVDSPKLAFFFANCFGLENGSGDGFQALPSSGIGL